MQSFLDNFSVQVGTDLLIPVSIVFAPVWWKDLSALEEASRHRYRFVQDIYLHRLRIGIGKVHIIVSKIKIQWCATGVEPTVLGLEGGTTSRPVPTSTERKYISWQKKNGFHIYRSPDNSEYKVNSLQWIYPSGGLPVLYLWLLPTQLCGADADICWSCDNTSMVIVQFVSFRYSVFKHAAVSSKNSWKLGTIYFRFDRKNENWK